VMEIKSCFNVEHLLKEQFAECSHKQIKFFTSIVDLYCHT
jgi:hypothetical protein